VFRSTVQPAELARACAKEMDRRKKLGVGRLAPTMRSVLLSPTDGDALGGFAETLGGELATDSAGYAREQYQLAARPSCSHRRRTKLGCFMVIGELLSPEEMAAEMGGPTTRTSMRTPPVNGLPRPPRGHRSERPSCRLSSMRTPKTPSTPATLTRWPHSPCRAWRSMWRSPESAS
jgi:hypothetical protein